MEDMHATLKELQTSLQNLLKRYDSLKKENEHLKQINADINKLVLEKDNAIKSSEEKLAINNIGHSYNAEEKELLRIKIDTYLKDIEKCLNLLDA